MRAPRPLPRPRLCSATGTPRSPQSRRYRAPAPEHDNTLSAHGREHWPLALLGRRKATEYQQDRARGGMDARSWRPLSRSDPYLDRTHPDQRLCHRPRSVRRRTVLHRSALSCACPPVVPPPPAVAETPCIKRSKSRQRGGGEPTRRGTRWTSESVDKGHQAAACACPAGDPLLVPHRAGCGVPVW